MLKLTKYNQMKFLFMRLITMILFLIFCLQFSARGDDIKDFEIEGLSLGDSLLDRMTVDEILEFDQGHYDDDSKFFETQLPVKTDIYDYLLFHVKNNDPRYKIYLIRGVNLVQSKSDCIKDKDIIVNEISKLFSNTSVREGSQKHYYYKNSTQYISQFDFKKGFVKVECMIMHNKDIKLYGDIPDTLEISIVSDEFRNWLNTL